MVTRFFSEPVCFTVTSARRRNHVGQARVAKDGRALPNLPDRPRLHDQFAERPRGSQAQGFDQVHLHRRKSLSYLALFFPSRQIADASTVRFVHLCLPQIKYEENLPGVVCHVCLYKLNMWSEFKEQFVQSNKVLLEQLEISEVSDNAVSSPGTFLFCTLALLWHKILCFRFRLKILPRMKVV